MDWPSVHLLVFFLSHFFKKKPIRIVEQSTIVIFTIVWTYLLFTKEKKNRAKSHQGVGMPIFVHRKVLFRIQNTLYFAKPSNWKIVFFSEEGTWYIISVFQLAEFYFFKKKNAWNCYTFLIRYFRIISFCKCCLVRKNDQ